MGQKANLNGSHLSVLKDWNSIWYLSAFEYKKILNEDFLIYKLSRSLKKKFFNVIKIRVCRISNNLIVELYYSFELQPKHIKQQCSPHFLIKWKKNKISQVTNKVAFTISALFISTKNVYIGFYKINSFILQKDVNFIAKKIAFLIENRIKFRSRTIIKIIIATQKIVSGIFVSCSGRLNGVDMARSDFFSKGSISFQNLNKNVSYGYAVAATLKGLQSVKVCIYI
jgi:small subunit ribosomal protein S3